MGALQLAKKLRNLVNALARAEKFRDFDGIPKNPKYSNIKKSKKVKRLFISDANRDFADLIQKHNIEFLHKEDFYREILKSIRPYVLEERWPFADDLPIRMLYDLDLWGFTKREQRG